MKITYIHHSSFLIELDCALLLFDYTDGPLPQLNPEKELAVFSSHRHGDHFSPAIFDLAKQHPKVLYLLSDDIWQNRVPQELYGNTEFIGPGDTLDLTECGGMRVTAFTSTDEGVAFLVQCGGITLYHAGDLNDWRWNSESNEWNEKMHTRYLHELEHIRDGGICPEVAFLPLDGRLEEWFYLGLHEYMEQIGAGTVFPMHFWDDYTLIGRLKELAQSEGYRNKIVDIHTTGQEFLLPL